MFSRFAFYFYFLLLLLLYTYTLYFNYLKLKLNTKRSKSKQLMDTIANKSTALDGGSMLGARAPENFLESELVLVA